MRGPVATHRIQGASTLLFERLTETGGPPDAQTGPAHVHKLEALKASVRAQLTCLLNTRIPLSIDAVEARPRTALDYGLPDLSAFPVGDGDARARLARHIAHAVTIYEPRLQGVAVTLQPPISHKTVMLAHVTGKLTVGAVPEPVSFRLVVNEPRGGVDGVR